MADSDAVQRSRRGFTLVELLVVIAVVILLLALLLPTLGSLQSDRREAICANNLRNLGLGLAAARHSDAGPIESSDWTTAILPYVGGDARLLNCPEHGDLAGSYGMNNRAHRFGDHDAHRVALLDYHTTAANLVVRNIAEQDDWNAAAGTFVARHAGRINVLTHSGSVQAKTPAAIEPRTTDSWLANWRPHQDLFVISGGVDEEKADATDETTTDPPSLTLAALSSGLSPAAMSDPPDYPPVDPDLCNYLDPSVLDDADVGDFTTVYDDANGYHVEFLPGFFLGPLHEGQWRTVNKASAVGQKQTQAWGYQTSGTRATYEFNVTPGKYKVWATWFGDAANSPTSPYEVYDGDTLVHSQAVDQEANPSSLPGAKPFKDGLLARFWFPLDGEHLISTGTLKVVITAAAGSVHPNDDGASYPDFQAASELVVADAVRIDCVRAPFYADRCHGEEHDPVDNGDSGNTATSGWSSVIDVDSVGGSHVTAPAGSGSETVAYSFLGLTSGQYSVWTYFETATGQATNAPFTVQDGSYAFEPVLVNQSYEYEGADLDGDGRLWYRLGYFEVRDGDVTVTVSDAADGPVVADAVRLHCAFGTSSDCPDEIYGRACRRAKATEYGATTETEDAVDQGLAWLAKHQLADGSWNFDHHLGTGDYILPSPDPCAGRCEHVGALNTFRVAATGMALLPFVGAGIGPADDTYGDVVAAGINYLLYANGDVVNEGQLWSGPDASVWANGSMAGYEQGVAGLALLETLAICRESGYGDVNQSDLNAAGTAVTARIVSCQTEFYGGWRYHCTADADMPVTTWNLNAIIASASMGINLEGMNPGYGVFNNVRTHLKSVEQSPDVVADPVYGDFSTAYRYRVAEYFFGGEHFAGFQHAVLGSPLQAAGLQQLADNMAGQGVQGKSYHKYYDHYFIKRAGGARWDTWNQDTKDYLLGLQETTGHEMGSWIIGGTGYGTITGNCGRLWDTVSSLLRLEAYYRDFPVSETASLGNPSVPGDTDGDGDVDVNDILQGFSHFTGPNPDPPAPAFTKTRAEGDVHPDGAPDGDVDVNDLLLMFSEFTGPG